jgi:hypothetical protein
LSSARALAAWWPPRCDAALQSSRSSCMSTTRYRLSKGRWTGSTGSPGRSRRCLGFASGRFACWAAPPGLPTT